MENRTIREMKEDILIRLLLSYNDTIERAKWWEFIKIHRLVDKRDAVIKKIGNLDNYGD
tara:strand:+ start:213 stop:389 length:177 start_codon:yes stop_codon:yes gene_type:complete